MPTDHRAALSNIKTFPQLIAYLRDEMGWPINGDSFEVMDDLFYDFTADELGIDPKTAAKITEIKRLKPLSTRQPWGIFFVKFEPKKLPVVALRRILSQVALKKRASANSADRTAWAADDLLFVSNYGEGSERRISFAHFAKPKDGHDLPTLKVLGWDNRDTALHLDAVAKELTQHLAWPDDDADVEAWRKGWRGAFTLRHGEVVTTSKELSIRLARLAGDIRDRIKSALAIETDRGPLTKLMKAFQTSLVHDLDADAFADMYAQTIAYGLLSARIADPHKKTVDDFAGHMRTNPFLRELMETFLKVGGRRGKAGGPGIDFDELGVSEVVQRSTTRTWKRWKMPKARAKFRLRPVAPERVLRLTYRPFDQRFVHYDKAVVFNPRTQIMSHLAGGTNLALISVGQNESLVFNHAFVSRNLVEAKTGTHYGASVVFPLHLDPAAAHMTHQLFAKGDEPRSNFAAAARPLLQIAEQSGRPSKLSPEQSVFYYIYAVLYSRAYRRRYAEQFLTEFPRIPSRPTQKLFGALVQFGEELADVHLMESKMLDKPNAKFAGKLRRIARVRWTEENGGTIWIDGNGTAKGFQSGMSGFCPVASEVWNFHVGGYQVCEKWLKDRKGRALTKDDIAHYEKIIVALEETIRVMQEIDAVIEQHGGWPGAFRTGEAQAAAPKIVPLRPRIVQPGPKERYVSCVPLVPLEVAAGAFGDPQHIDDAGFDWAAVETQRRLRPGMFVAQVVGKSMEPAIPDGSYCLFAAPVDGTRQGKTVLVQLHDATDPESGERYTVKRYESEKAQDGELWRHTTITLKPANPDFKPIVLTDTDEGQLQVVAEVVEVLSGLL